MKRLAILGASGHGKVVADAALAAGWDEVHFFDDSWPERRHNGNWPIAGAFTEMTNGLGHTYDSAVVAIGQNETRLARAAALKSAGVPLATLIHPSATISPHASVGEGTVIFAGVVVNVDVLVGQCCIINTSATVDHDCELADGVHLSPGVHLGGNVVVGRASWLGIGACVRHGIRIGSNVVVGAGAAVVDDLQDNNCVVGVPAKLLVRDQRL